MPASDRKTDLRSGGEPKLYGIEAAGEGIATGRHAATLTAGRIGVLHGSKSYVLTHTDDRTHRPDRARAFGQRGPRLSRRRSRARAFWKQSGAVTYPVAHRRRSARRRSNGSRAPKGFCAALRNRACDRRARRDARSSRANKLVIVVGLSGRGDKDMDDDRRITRGDVNRDGPAAHRVRSSRARTTAHAPVAYLTFGDPDLATSIAVMAQGRVRAKRRRCDRARGTVLQRSVR